MFSSSVFVQQLMSFGLGVKIKSPVSVAVEIGAYGSLESFQVLCACYNASAILRIISEIANVFLINT
jgi:hypothetical protein